MAGRAQHFPKELRLRKRGQFLAMRRCARIKTNHFIVVWRPAAGLRSRLGVTVTKRVANAVGRNRVKRMVREAFRRSDWPAAGVDLVVIAKAGAPKLGGREVAAQMEEAYRLLPKEHLPSELVS